MQQTLGKYHLDDALGQGGMGAVYRSYHPQLNRPVAVKLMLASQVADPQAQARFLREAQVVAGLSHPNIINIFDVDVQNNQPYIVMEYVAGGSLADRLRAGPLQLDEALKLAIPLADALTYAHAQGLIHRDLKPANVLLRPDGTPVLADFGLARSQVVESGDQITATGAVLGTLAYMAPEQFSGRSVDARADIYAFGVLLFEMLTETLPFSGDSAQVMYGHLQTPPPSIRSVNPAVPEALDRLLLQMMAKDPSDRPQNMVNVASALRALAGATAATGPTIALNAGGQVPQRRRVLMMLLVPAIVALCLLSLLLLVLTRRPAETDESGASTLPSLPPVATSASVVDLDAPTARPPDWITEAPAVEFAKVEPETFSVGGITYRKDADSVWFFGEVRNDGEQTRERVQVRIVLRDDAGKELATKSSSAEMSYLKPSEVSPFSVLFSKDDAPPPFARYDVEVRSEKAEFELQYTYRDVRVIGEPRAVRSSLGFVNISGRVRNDGAQPAKYVQVYAVFYDAAANIVGIASTFAEDTAERALQPAADARFEIQGIVFSAPPASFRLFAEASNAQK